MMLWKTKTRLTAAIGVFVLLILGLTIWIFAEDPITYSKPVTGYISPSGISIQGETAYVSDATSNKVYGLNLTNGTVISSYTANQPVHSVLAANNTVYALEGGLSGNLIKLNANLSRAEQIVETGHTPTAMQIYDGKLYIACRYSNAIYVYKETSLELLKKIEVSREPMALTLQGSDLYVANHLSDGSSVAETVSAKVTVIDTVSDTVSKEISLQNGSGGVKGICTSSDGRYVYISHILARYTYPITQIDRGWVNTNAITILDTASKEVLTSVLLDNLEEGAANPWGITCTGTQLIVTLSGTNEIMAVDTEAMLAGIQQVIDGRHPKVASLAEIPNYLPFMDAYKTRIPIAGQGLRTIAAKEGQVYICGYFTGDIHVYDIESQKASGSISLGTQPEADAARRGELLWNDANNCYQKWQSCASCHPEARVDALNWDTLGDGLGNPKNVRSIVYSHRVPPVLTTGLADNAEISVRAGTAFNNLKEEDFLDMDAYLKSISPIQSPYLNRDGTLSEAAEKGKSLFASEGCIACHYGPNFTDLKLHPSQHRVEGWENRDFKTATLVEVWNTGPWFASGQFKTLREAVAASLKAASKLSPEELDQLTAYVASIGNSGEYYGIEQVKLRKADGTETYNQLFPNGQIYEITVRKQLAVHHNAKITIALYSADHSKSLEKSFTLAEMETGDTARIPMRMDIDADLKPGAYYKVSIAAEDGTPLATDLTIYHN